MKCIANREVSVEADHLLSLGFVYEGPNGNGHYNFTHPKHGATFLPATPSDWRWRKNHRATVARQMGISLRELEDRLGIQRRQSGRVKFRKNEKPRQNFLARLAEKTAADKPEPPNLPTVEERFERVKAEIEETHIRLNLAMPGSTTYQETLAKASRLRAELMQLREDKEAA